MEGPEQTYAILAVGCEGILEAVDVYYSVILLYITRLACRPVVSWSHIIHKNLVIELIWQCLFSSRPEGPE